ncbi:MAG TPA: ATP-binding protein [Nocardia sp.]|uniref:ATP-binding protein n=1 Tax=Nocardia farcinica TaxID=37329 RepID=UPI002454E63A|nr:MULTISPECIES: ATP-binding protein [Nocardia]HLS76002.1 ATP-binding protein [Nocardia sp.]
MLLLPVVLASTFAALRINDELNLISQLDAATAQAQLVRPMLTFGAAAEELAIAAVTAEPGSDADVVTDEAAAEFDQATADLETALRSVEADDVTQELSAAIAAGRAMRNGLRASSPVTIAEQVGQVGDRIIAATAVSNSLEEITIQRYFLQLGLIANKRRLLTQEHLTVATSDANPASQANLLTMLGAEMVLINVYAYLSPDSAANADVLLEAVQTRIGAIGQSTGRLSQNEVVYASLGQSTDAYTEATGILLDIIDRKLADRTAELRGVVLRDIAIVVTTLLAGLALALAVARSLVLPIRRLRHGALQVAHVDLPNELEVVRSGGATPEPTRVDVHTTEEIGQLARAIDDIHGAALHLAAEQARLRLQIGSMFETLSRRSQSLVEQQLSLIEELEHDEDDSGRLQSLFRLDHLATRMRRNGDNLLVLAGTALRRGHLPPVPLSDMLWSAVSQVEDYQRVEIGAAPDGVVPGEPAVDIEHLLAELIDNALRYSPPTTSVAVSVARSVDGGYLIEIMDRGLGMSAEDLQTVNSHLASGGEVTVETARRMGLFVVGRLAKRHNITVNLRRTSAMTQQPGITASVHLPGSLVTTLPPTDKNPKELLSPTPSKPEQTSSFDLPGAPQPRILQPVPTPAQAEAGEPPRSAIGTGSNGLPQRRPAIRVAPSPEQNASGPATGESPKVDVWAEPAEYADTPAPESFPAEALGPDYATQTYPVQDGKDTGADTAESNATGGGPDGADSHPTEVYSGGSARAFDSYQGDPYVTDVYVPGDPVPQQVPIPRREPSGASAQTDSGQSSPAQTTSTGLRPVTTESPTPIYQRMVSEWLVEPASSGSEGEDDKDDASGGHWSAPGDTGWKAAAEASKPTVSGRTNGGLPIRRPGAQLVPGGLAPANESNARDPEEIRNSLTRHLSGVRSGRADAQYNDGGLE